MKKILFSIIVVVALIGFGVYQKLQSAGSGQAVPTSTPSKSSSSSTPTPSSSSATYKDGTYTGTQTDAIYGPMQVQITIAGGKISDVTFLKYPNDRGHTTEVSSMSLPILKQEAIAVQNASVDNVSGATQTSDAFKQSLASALAKAQ